jgi:hypothetical protein
MAYRKATLRRMQPITRRYARILNDLDGVLRKLRNLTEEVGRLELDSRALFQRQEHERTKGHEPANLDEFMSDYFKQQEENDEL